MQALTFLSMLSQWKAWVEQTPMEEAPEPCLYQAFITKTLHSQGWAFSHPLSHYFSDNQSTVEMKMEILKLLSIALKAHYFLFKKELLREEPFIFYIPNFNKPNLISIGLQYSVGQPGRSIFISQMDLSALSSGKMNLVKFPVVIHKTPEHWVDIQHWETLEKERKWVDAILNTPAKQDQMDIQAWKDHSTFPYGALFEGLSEQGIRVLRLCGARWAQGIQQWYLPKGFDKEPVQSYLLHIEKQIKKAGDLL